MAKYTPTLSNKKEVRALERLSIHADGKRAYDERWLQDLIHSCPRLLPVDDIEPGFGDLIPIAREVGCGSGMIDNLFLTGDGGIALVEVKLWRNPEARRMVVAQALDYAAAISTMNYADFEKAILSGQLEQNQRPASLYDLIREQPDALDESSFIDAISANLRRGRMLVLVAGDGIRSETETLANALQSHAGARFTFALVSIELFSTGEPGQILAIPRTLTKTVLIERGVVKIDDGQIKIAVPDARRDATRRTTMTQDLFMEAMAQRDPSLPAALDAFLREISAYGVQAEWKAALNLKWYGRDEGPVNLGYIRKDGTYWTEVVHAKIGRDLALPYLEEIANLTGGKVRDSGIGPFVVTRDGKNVVSVGRLLPSHSEGWAKAIRDLLLALKERSAEE